MIVQSHFFAHTCGCSTHQDSHLKPVVVGVVVVVVATVVVEAVDAVVVTDVLEELVISVVSVRKGK